MVVKTAKLVQSVVKIKQSLNLERLTRKFHNQDFIEEEYLLYIREVESAYDHSHDMSGGAVWRYSSERNDRKAPHQAVGTAVNRMT